VPNPIDHRRLTLARKRAGMTKRDIAQELGLSPASITQYEAGRTQPRPTTVRRLALILGCPAEYFDSTVDRRPAGVASAPFYRSLRATRQWERDQAEALSEHLWDLLWELERQFELPPVDLPDVSVPPPGASRGHLESVAEEVRDAWQMPHGAVGHAVRLLEAHGILITRLSGGSPRMDAFSRWMDGRPVVMLWDAKDDKARSRFDACHELGHLVLHQDEREPDQVLERQASAFASALLMPAEAIEPELPRRPPRPHDWDQLFDTRRRWGVSVAALFYRAREVGTLSEASFRRAMIRLSEAGLRSGEGGDLGPPEQPTFLGSIVAAYLSEHDLELDDLAARLRMGRRQLLEILGPSFGAGDVSPPGRPWPEVAVVMRTIDDASA
jgi:Zn-dependent peptidase ImmA (M78 family)/transcriptional regulator with XRE-family HTH domain